MPAGLQFISPWFRLVKNELPRGIAPGGAEVSAKIARCRSGFCKGARSDRGRPTAGLPAGEARNQETMLVPRVAARRRIHRTSVQKTNDNIAHHSGGDRACRPDHVAPASQHRDGARRLRGFGRISLRPASPALSASERDGAAHPSGPVRGAAADRSADGRAPGTLRPNRCGRRLVERDPRAHVRCRKSRTRLRAEWLGP